MVASFKVKLHILDFVLDTGGHTDFHRQALAFLVYANISRFAIRPWGLDRRTVPLLFGMGGDQALQVLMQSTAFPRAEWESSSLKTTGCENQHFGGSALGMQGNLSLDHEGLFDELRLESCPFISAHLEPLVDLTDGEQLFYSANKAEKILLIG